MTNHLYILFYCNMELLYYCSVASACVKHNKVILNESGIITTKTQDSVYLTGTCFSIVFTILLHLVSNLLNFVSYSNIALL